MTSNDYTQTLKSIKEAEETSRSAIAERKAKLAEQVERAREEASKEVAAANAAAEAYIAKEVDSMRSAAEADSKILISSTVIDAEKVATKKVGKAELKKIIEDILFSEFKGA